MGQSDAEDDVNDLLLAALLTKGTNNRKKDVDDSKPFQQSGNLIEINAIQNKSHPSENSRQPEDDTLSDGNDEPEEPLNSTSEQPNIDSDFDPEKYLDEIEPESSETSQNTVQRTESTESTLSTGLKVETDSKGDSLLLPLDESLLGSGTTPVGSANAEYDDILNFDFEDLDNIDNFFSKAVKEEPKPVKKSPASKSSSKKASSTESAKKSKDSSKSDGKKSDSEKKISKSQEHTNGKISSHEVTSSKHSSTHKKEEKLTTKSEKPDITASTKSPPTQKSSESPPKSRATTGISSNDVSSTSGASAKHVKASPQKIFFSTESASESVQSTDKDVAVAREPAPKPNPGGLLGRDQQRKIISHLKLDSSNPQKVGTLSQDTKNEGVENLTKELEELLESQNRKRKSSPEKKVTEEIEEEKKKRAKVEKKSRRRKSGKDKKKRRKRRYYSSSPDSSSNTESSYDSSESSSESEEERRKRKRKKKAKKAKKSKVSSKTHSPTLSIEPEVRFKQSFDLTDPYSHLPDANWSDHLKSPPEMDDDDDDLFKIAPKKSKTEPPPKIAFRPLPAMASSKAGRVEKPLSSLERLHAKHRPSPPTYSAGSDSDNDVDLSVALEGLPRPQSNFGSSSLNIQRKIRVLNSPQVFRSHDDVDGRELSATSTAPSAEDDFSEDADDFFSAEEEKRPSRPSSRNSSDVRSRLSAKTTVTARVSNSSSVHSRLGKPVRSGAGALSRIL